MVLPEVPEVPEPEPEPLEGEAELLLLEPDPGACPGLRFSAAEAASAVNACMVLFPVAGL